MKFYQRLGLVNNTGAPPRATAYFDILIKSLAFGFFPKRKVQVFSNSRVLFRS